MELRPASGTSEALLDKAFSFKRTGIETGPLSQRFYEVLAEAELPAICVEMRHMKAALSAWINKSDRKAAERTDEAT